MSVICGALDVGEIWTTLFGIVADCAIGMVALDAISPMITLAWFAARSPGKGNTSPIFSWKAHVFAGAPWAGATVRATAAAVAAVPASSAAIFLFLTLPSFVPGSDPCTLTDLQSVRKGRLCSGP